MNFQISGSIENNKQFFNCVSSMQLPALKKTGRCANQVIANIKTLHGRLKDHKGLIAHHIAHLSCGRIGSGNDSEEEKLTEKKSAKNKRCEIAPTNIVCPECGHGTLEPARGRFGPIYKCTNKGECKFWLGSRPTGDVCAYPRDGVPCGQLMVEGTKTIPDRCSDRECPNRNPHKLDKAG